MKKTMMFLAALIFAVSTQAASLNWTIANVSTPADSSIKGVSYTAYLFLTEVGGALTYDTTTTEAVIGSINDGTFGTTIKAQATGKTNAKGGIMGATGLDGMTAGDSLSGFAIIFDGDYSSEKGNYMITDIKSANWTSSTGAKTLAFGSQASNTWNPYTAVPEPTTMALLALGIAAFGLRRKVRA